MRFCRSAITLASILLVPGMAVGAKEAPKATQPVADATRPAIILSFIAGVAEPDARFAAREYRALNIGKMQGSMGVREDALQAMIAKTALWVPYYYESLQRRFGAGSVILDPLFVKRSGDGSLILSSAVESGLAPFRQLFMAYQMPWDNGSGSPQNPSSRGPYAAFATLDLAPTVFPDRNASWSVVVGAANPAWKSLKVQKVDSTVFTQVTGSATGRPSGLSVPPLDSIAETTAQKVRPLLANVAPQLLAYSRILGLPDENGGPFHLVPQFLAGETKFRKTRSAALSDYLQNSDYAGSIKDTAREEDKQVRQQHAGMFASLLGAVAAGAAGFSDAGASTMAYAQSMSEANNRTLQAAVAQQSALASLAGEQVNIGSLELGGAQNVSASSVQELRQRFRAIASKQGAGK